MTRHYIRDPDAKRGFAELTEEEWIAMMGNDAVRPYAKQGYRGDIAIEDVPEELREAVQTVVDNRIARWGLYSEREIAPKEALTILTGGADE